ncbi:MAG: extracellular solute-binding protein [Phycisphaerales bacterium]|jgi:iron(III) transport system substrate-binding protein|nr:extracellular solute-binding protein [Phycisphaerales bacterium]
MNRSIVLVILGLVAVLGVPLVMRPSAARARASAEQTLVVITPHVPQIRAEFAAAFDRWHRRKHGSGVSIDYRTPGGTSEIIRFLQSVYSAHAIRVLDEIRSQDPAALADPKLSIGDRFKPGSMDADIVFGGGSFDHGRLKDSANVAVWIKPWKERGVTDVQIGPLPKGADAAKLAGSREVTLPVSLDGTTIVVRVPVSAIEQGTSVVRAMKADAPVSARVDLSRVEREVQVSMSAPAGLDPGQLKQLIGDNVIGAQTIYDPDQYWIGVAFSSFGVVFNRDWLGKLQLGDPTSFDDMGLPEFVGLVALADPRLSGSITTSMDAILSAYGWEKGWRVLRSMCANTRYYTAASSKPPIDVSQGEAAIGLAIDFYGRGQAQSILRPGQDASESRVGYVDPPGVVYIDADPISVLRGAPHPELARRFIEFCLTDEGQALWQFHAKSDPRSGSNPKNDAGEPMGPDQYELRRMPVRRDFYRSNASFFIDKVEPFAVATSNKPAGWRSAIGPILGACAVDTADEQREAWRAIIAAERDAAFPREVVATMKEMFFSFPPHTTSKGETIRFSPETMKAIRDDWRDAKARQAAEVSYVRYFRKTYAQIVEISRTRTLPASQASQTAPGPGHSPAPSGR